MARRTLSFILYVGCILRYTLADFNCLCNYNVETNVMDSPGTNGQILGHLYEFDCKPVYPPWNNGAGNNDYMAVQYDNKIGFVKTNDQIQEQICPGEPSPNDIVTITTTIQTTVTSTTQTSTKPTTTKTSTKLYSSGSPVVTTTTKPTTTTQTTSTSTAAPSTSTQPTTTMKTTRSNSPMTSTQRITTRTTSQHITSRRTTIRPSTTLRTTRLTTRPSKPASTTQTTHQTTTRKQGLDVSGIPLQYIGVGYNLLHGNPDGNQYGSNSLDEGINLNKRILQITGSSSGDPLEAEYTLNVTSCTPVTRASILFDEMSYQQQLKGLVRIDGSHPRNLTDKSFTISPEFRHLYPMGSLDTTIYRDVTTTCTSGYARYKTEQITNNYFGVTEEFAAAVTKLPTTYDIVPYWKFLETWGTSIVISTKLGQRTTKRYHISKLQAFEHVQKLAPNLIKHTGPYMGYASSLSIDTDNYTLSNSTTDSEFGTLQTTIYLGSSGDPKPISIDVVPISYAVDIIFWKKLEIDGILNPRSLNLVNIKNNIDTALQAYATLMSAPTVHNNPLQIPVTWPEGTYGVMKASTGCPGGHVAWAEGWRKQDTEDHDAANHYTPNINNYMAGSKSSHQQWRKQDTEDHDAANHYTPNINNYMAGIYGPNNLQTEFCIKKNISSSQYDRPWPRGKYCLLQYYNCPTGFKRGYLIWDDEDGHNHNAYGGAMPTGSFTSNTKIYYCCRTDGEASSSISLPTDNPFILLRYDTLCQTVYGMTVTDIYVRWDDEDTPNLDGRWGTHPYDDGGSKDHRLHFCHYKSIHGSSFVPGIVG